MQVTGWGSIYFNNLAKAFNVTAEYTPSNAGARGARALTALLAAAGAGSALLLLLLLAA